MLRAYLLHIHKFMRAFSQYPSRKDAEWNSIYLSFNWVSNSTCALRTTCNIWDSAVLKQVFLHCATNSWSVGRATYNIHTTSEDKWTQLKCILYFGKKCLFRQQKRDELMSLNSPNGHTTHTISILNAQFVDVLKCVFAILCLECGVIWNEESVFFPKQNFSFQPNHHYVECVMCTHFARSMFHKVEMLRRLSIGTKRTFADDTMFVFVCACKIKLFFCLYSNNLNGIFIGLFLFLWCHIHYSNNGDSS